MKLIKYFLFWFLFLFLTLFFSVLQNYLYEWEFSGILIFISFFIFLLAYCALMMLIQKVFLLDELFVGLNSFIGVMAIFWCSNIPGESWVVSFNADLVEVAPSDIQEAQNSRYMRLVNAEFLYDRMGSYKVTSSTNNETRNTFWYIYVIPFIQKGTNFSSPKIAGFIYSKTKDMRIKEKQLFIRAPVNSNINSAIYSLENVIELPEKFLLWDIAENDSVEEEAERVAFNFHIYFSVINSLFLLITFFMRKGLWAQEAVSVASTQENELKEEAEEEV